MNQSYSKPQITDITSVLKYLLVPLPTIYSLTSFHSMVTLSFILSLMYQLVLHVLELCTNGSYRKYSCVCFNPHHAYDIHLHSHTWQQFGQILMFYSFYILISILICHTRVTMNVLLWFSNKQCLLRNDKVPKNSLPKKCPVT